MKNILFILSLFCSLSSCYKNHPKEAHYTLTCKFGGQDQSVPIVIYDVERRSLKMNGKVMQKRGKYVKGTIWFPFYSNSFYMYGEIDKKDNSISGTIKTDQFYPGGVYQYNGLFKIQ